MASLLENIKLAIDMEKKGYDVYMSTAGKTTNKLGKETLEAIAKKELDHIRAIEEFNKTISGVICDPQTAMAMVNVQDKAKYVTVIMDKIRGELKAKVKRDADLEKAYEVAMGLEKEAYNFYKKLAGETADPQAKKFFEFLMKEENTHYELLQETLEYLNHPADWFKEQERWIVEG